MDVICVNESQKKALIRSRRILGKYLNQVGSRTWIGRISEEGLRDMKLALKAGASRHTSVACHRVVTRYRTQLYWIVGSNRNFDEEGRYAFKASGNILDLYAGEMPVRTKLLRYVTRLAALFHDLGKITRAFQRKLKKYDGDRAEAVRHDLLSCLILWQALKNVLGEDIRSDAQWLELFDNGKADPDAPSIFDSIIDQQNRICIDSRDKLEEKLKDKLKEKIDKNSDRSEKTCEIEDLLNDPWVWERTPLLASICWLILSHHRLPNGRRVGSKRKFARISVENFLNPRYICNFEDCFRIEDRRFLPWLKESWQLSLTDCIKNLRRLLNDHADTLCEFMPKDDHPPWNIDRDNPQWFDLLAHQARPMLVYADYHGSIAKRCPKVSDDELRYAPFANTEEPHRFNRGRPDLPGRLNYLADPLWTHLLSVRSKVDYFFRLAHNANTAHSVFNYIEPDEILKESGWCQKTPDNRFVWQVDAEKKLKRIRNIKDVPFFGAVLSETGSGKTIGGARIMKNVSKNLRFTLALGLRSLTLQSGKSYQENLKLHDHHVATIIGSTITKSIFDLEDKEREEGPANEEEILGAEGFSEYEKQNPYEVEYHPLKSDPNLEKVFGGAKAVKMLSSPILVATVDHIIHCTEMSRSAEGRMLMRVMTSDLILDEIDNYRANDLISMGKLVYLHGLYGRNVILMSATLSPVVFEGMWQAYHAGLRVFSYREGRPFCCNVGLFSNRVDPLLLKNMKETTGIMDSYSAFIDQFAESLQCQEVRHRLSIIEVSAGEYHDQVLAACFDKHKNNYTVDPSSGKRFSIGFVRWNRVSSARAFAHFLYNSDQVEEYEYRVVCYHSKYMVLELYAIERVLNRILNRTHPEDIFRDALVRGLLDSVEKEDIMIIVSTTSIQETGRDHDYDWNILEPCSTRSVIQSAGRVERHRKHVLESDVSNIGLLSHPVNALEGKSSGVWAYPGIETNENYRLCKHPKGKTVCETLRAAGIIFESAGESEAIRLAEEAFAVVDWNESVTSMACLRKPEVYEDEPLTALEYVEFYDALMKEKKDNEDFKGSLGGYLHNASVKLLNQHARMTYFRRLPGQDTIDLYKVDLDEEEIEGRAFRISEYQRGETDKSGSAESPEFFESEVIKNPHYAFIKLNQREIFEELMERLNLFRDSSGARILLTVSLGGTKKNKGRDGSLRRDLQSGSKCLHYHPLLGFDLVNRS